MCIRDSPNTIWFNVFVSNIEETFSRAIDSGCTQIQAITYLPDHGMSNAMFKDCFGYIWPVSYTHLDVYKRQALKFNEMVRKGEIGPVMLGRDHHDVSGTDSPFRETANIKDGSNVMADMATQCYAGNAARGMSLVALHNGGGVGIGKSINGGFGLVLDGSERGDNIIKSALLWDVMGGCLLYTSF